MPQFNSELIEVMKEDLEDIMIRVPLAHSTPAAKAYFAECILKAAAQGQTNYDALIVGRRLIRCRWFCPWSPNIWFPKTPI